MTPGSASGLPNTPCISAPAQPSEAPTSSASAILGKRTFHSTDSATRSGAAPPRWARCSTEPSTSAAGTG